MKTRLCLIGLLAAIVLGSCAAAPVEPYDDVRGKDLSRPGGLGESLLKTLWFNRSTDWSEQDREIAETILQLGMNPGLGIHELHRQGITGKGVNVAIIDQNMLLDHPEFRGKIAAYHDVGTNTAADEGSMHGPAVTSLLVGENIGTAPEARVYYAAAPSWTGDAQYYADALDWLIAENEALPEGEKIRVVSVSARPSGEGSPFKKNHDAWDAAYRRATEAGLLVLDCTHEHGLTAPCYSDLHDAESPAACVPGWPGMDDYVLEKNRILIPSSLRTTAEEYSTGDFSYQYTGRGGLSWSTPYLAGVLAMGWQIDPGLSGAELLDMLFATAYVTDGNEKVIDPPAFIEAVRRSLEE